jgi:hypothetical protein
MDSALMQRQAETPTRRAARPRAPDEADDRPPVGEDSDHVCSPPDLLFSGSSELFDKIRRQCSFGTKRCSVGGAIVLLSAWDR